MDDAMDHLDNYVLEQAKIEIDHARTWPTKALAFFVTANFGLVGSLIGLRNTGHPLIIRPWEKAVLLLVIFILAAWAIGVLARNHRNYLRYRNIQIQFQKANLHFQTPTPPRVVELVSGGPRKLTPPELTKERRHWEACAATWQPYLPPPSMRIVKQMRSL
jgi:hypothetical protein